MIADLPVITEPRDLAPAGRLFRSVFSFADRINPFLAASQPADLEFDAAGRAGQVAALCAARDAIADEVNARRLQEWAARYRPHVFAIPMQLPAWDSKFPASERGMRSIRMVRR